MLVQPTEVEGEQSERPSELQLTPSPPHLSEVHVEPQSDPSPRPSPTSHIPDSIPESSGGNHGDQAKEIKHLKAQIKKLKKKAKPVITHHKAWMKSVSMKQRLAGKKSLKTQGRKSAKAEPLVHKDPAFDELDDDEIDYMETGVAQYVGRDKIYQHEGTVIKLRKKVLLQHSTYTPTILEMDDTLLCSSLLNMSQAKAVSREKEKGVELKDVENIERPRPTSTRSLLTLKPLPKIDPKDKGKKKIEEEGIDHESGSINESENKRIV
ncbi:hypothetical protein Tco_0808605 [Tanacetum coccineum]